MSLGGKALGEADFTQASLNFVLANQALPDQADAERMVRYAHEFEVIAVLQDVIEAAATQAVAAQVSRKELLDRVAVVLEGSSRRDLRDMQGEVETALGQDATDGGLLAAQDKLRTRLAALGPAPKRQTQADLAAIQAAEDCEAAVANSDHRTAYTCLTGLVRADRNLVLPGGQRAASALAVTLAELEKRATPYYERGLKKLASSKLPAARDDFEAALRIYPDHGPSRQGLRDVQVGLEAEASEHLTRGRVYEQAHQVDKALREYGTALDLAGPGSKQGKLAQERITKLLE